MASPNPFRSQQPHSSPFGRPRPDAGPNPYGQWGQGGPSPQPRGPMGQGMQRWPGGASDASQQFMTKVFGWMTMGLGLTAVIAWMTFSSGLIWQVAPYFMPLMLVELAVVIGMTFGLRRMSAPVAIGAFLLYAGLNGLTFSAIFAAYTLGSIANVFLVTTMTFGFMFVYGWTTKKDLSSWGSLLLMALFGIIIASITNMFLFKSSMMSLGISILGVLIFVGLTAYDAQKIKAIGAYGFTDRAAEQKSSIMGALVLYLDFINLFLHLLRLMGSRR